MMKTIKACELFIQSRLNKNLRPATVRWYKNILLKFTGSYEDLPRSGAACERFIGSCQAGDERQHGYYRALKALYNFLEGRCYIKKNPMREVLEPERIKKLPRPIHPPDIARIWSHEMPPDIRAAIRFFVDAGTRLGECHNLDRDDLFVAPWGYAALVDGKTGQRAVPISFETYQLLIKTLPFRYKKDWLGRQISKTFKAAGVRGGAHNLRHTFGTYWDGDIDILQKIMGHSTINTTMIYREIRTEILAKQHRQYSPARWMLTGQISML
jgi:integrase